MKIVSFNINGIRARLHQLRAICESLQPEIIALQETKVRDEVFPHEMIQAFGYKAYIHGQSGHYGVALLSKLPPLTIEVGLPGEPADSQRRLITGLFATSNGGRLIVINGYFPQGSSRTDPVKFPHKQKFYADLTAHVQARFTQKQPLLIVGDMNIAPLDADVGIGAINAKRWLRTGACGFLPEEREWLANLTTWGLTDLFRLHHPHVTDRFSWFDYRSCGFEDEPRRGLRLDLMLATNTLAQRCKDSGVDYRIRAMERPSDHCPVWAEIDI